MKELFVLIVVPPQPITVATTPSIIYEGHAVMVRCKAWQLKPVDSLKIQLLNGTYEIEGKKLVHISIDDGPTIDVARDFTVLFSR